MIEKEGEDPREVWLAADKDEDAIAEIMTLTRSRRLLCVAAERATIDCPFFIEQTDIIENGIASPTVYSWRCKAVA